MYLVIRKNSGSILNDPDMQHYASFIDDRCVISKLLETDKTCMVYMLDQLPRIERIEITAKEVIKCKCS